MESDAERRYPRFFDQWPDALKVEAARRLKEHSLRVLELHRIAPISCDYCGKTSPCPPRLSALTSLESIGESPVQ